jgi:hypothetical protein
MFRALGDKRLFATGGPSLPRLSFKLIYNLEAVGTRLKVFMGLALVHFQK